MGDAGYVLNLAGRVARLTCVTGFTDRIEDLVESRSKKKLERQLRRAKERVRTRGKISEFSLPARRRAAEKVASIDFDPWLGDRSHYLLRVDLTWPDEVRPTDLAVAYSQVLAWMKRFDRKFGVRPMPWKREFTRRGGVHFHVWVLLPAEVHREADFIPWLAESWFAVVDSGMDKHLAAGTSCSDRCFDAQVASRYMTKYAVKGKPSKEYQHRVPDGVENLGRWWGVRNATVNRVEVRVPDRLVPRLRRILQSYRRREQYGRDMITGKVLKRWRSRAKRLASTRAGCDTGCPDDGGVRRYRMVRHGPTRSAVGLLDAFLPGYAAIGDSPQFVRDLVRWLHANGVAVPVPVTTPPVLSGGVKCQIVPGGP